MEMWADGAFMGPNKDEVMIRNATALGYISALQDLLNIDYVSLRGNEDE